MDDREGVRASTACEIVSKLQGVRNLILYSFYEESLLGMEILSYPSLHDLRYLQLDEVFLFSNGLTHSPSFPFSLSALSFWNSSNLLDQSPQPSYANVNRLELFMNNLEDDEHLYPFFASVAPQIYSLDLTYTTLPVLLPFYKTCVRLTELNLEGDTAAMIQALGDIPNPLLKLSVHLDNVAAFVSGIARILESRSLSNLKEFKIRDGPGIDAERVELENVEGGDVVKAYFKKRGATFV